MPAAPRSCAPPGDAARAWSTSARAGASAARRFACAGCACIDEHWIAYPRSSPARSDVLERAEAADAAPTGGALPGRDLLAHAARARYEAHTRPRPDARRAITCWWCRAAARGIREPDAATAQFRAGCARLAAAGDRTVFVGPTPTAATAASAAAPARGPSCIAWALCRRAISRRSCAARAWSSPTAARRCCRRSPAARRASPCRSRAIRPSAFGAASRRGRRAHRTARGRSHRRGGVGAARGRARARGARPARRRARARGRRADCAPAMERPSPAGRPCNGGEGPSCRMHCCWAIDLDQPSFRHRMRSIIAPLEAAGWQVRARAVPERPLWAAHLGAARAAALGRRGRAAPDQTERTRGAPVRRAQPSARIRRRRRHLRAQAAPAR